MTDKPFLALGITALAGAIAAGGIVAGSQTAVDIAKTEVKVEVVKPSKEKPSYQAYAIAASEDIECPGGKVNVGADTAVCYAEERPAQALAEKTTECLTVCYDKETGAYSVKWIAPGKLPEGCEQPQTKDGPICESLRISTGTETDLVKGLQEICDPCPVAPKHWGQCPICTHSHFAGGCTKACPEGSDDEIKD